MIAINDINDINKIIRKQLILQSELSSKYVRNALTTYGVTLDKLLSNQVYDTICPCDALLLFELQTRDNSADVSMTESDDSITYYRSYNVHIIIYGQNSSNVSTKLIARLRSENVRKMLYDEGIYVELVTNDTSINEYKNDAMWHRHDFDVYISCKLSVVQLSTLEYIEKLNTLNIIYEGDDL